MKEVSTILLDNNEENSFTQEDYSRTQEAFAKWQASECETVEQHILRQRKAQLNELVRKVIKNELNDQEQEFVRLHWYEGVPKAEIAKKFNLSYATIFRRFEKINCIIYEKLKYAVEYRYGINCDNASELIIASKVPQKDNSKTSDVSKRISNLRNKQYLSIDTVSKMTGISSRRLEELEKSKEVFTLTDVKNLSLAYGVTSDFLIFGKS